MSDAWDWFDARTAGAPEALVGAARAHLTAVPEGEAVDRLARAGERALRAADERGDTRDAALHLLAADALITLALLDLAERDPAGLGQAAASLRHRAAGGA